MKVEVISYYSRFDSVHWAENENDQWSGTKQKVQHYDLLTVGKRELDIRFEIHRMTTENELQIQVYIKTNDDTIVQLPIGRWKEK